MQFSLGAQLYTVRDFTKTPADIARTFEKVAAIGYTSAQASAMGPIDCGELARISRETGVEIAVTHTPAERILNDLDAVMREHETFGCRIVGLGGLPNEMRDTPEHIYDAIDRFGKAAVTLRKNGFLFGYHNHTWEFVSIDGKPILMHMLERTDPDAFRLILDAYWVQHAGVCPADFLERWGSRVCVLHLKDMAPCADNSTEFAEIGQGCMDYAKITAAAKKAGCPWYMVEQDVCRRDPFESLKMSFDHLKASRFLE